MRVMTAAALLLGIATAGIAQQPTASLTGEAGVKWGPAPAILPAGAQMAVLEGNPTGSGLFTVRLRLPNGYKIAPHTHPTDENVTVISGAFKVGMGTKFDSKAMMTLRPGGFVTPPANHAHYAAAEGETVVQVHAMGPFVLTYVNPADQPKAAGPR